MDYFGLIDYRITAISIGLIVFFVLTYALSKTNIHKGASIIVAFAVSAIVVWKLYNERIYELDGVIFLIFVLIVFGFLFKIAQAFINYNRYNFRRR